VISKCPECGDALYFDTNMLSWRCTNPQCRRVYAYDELPEVSVHGGNRIHQDKAQRHEESGTGSNEHHRPSAYRGSGPAYGDSSQQQPNHEPRRGPSRALKIAVITGVCISVVVLLIVLVNPVPLLRPSMLAGALNHSFAVDDGLNPNPYQIYLASSRSELDWSAVADAAWLNLDPLDGRTGEETWLTLSADISGMLPGEYVATVTVFASAAKNTPLEIPVSLSITNTEETLAIRRAVGGETGDVEIHYDKQPPYSKGAAYSNISLTNNPSATDPTWRQLLEFIASDDTDQQDYVEDVYVCGDFAEALHNNAEQEGIKAAWVAIHFADGTVGHALNAFNTVDQGIVFVDCTGGGFEVFTPPVADSQRYDRIAYVMIGKEYGTICIDIAMSGQYDYYERYEQQWEEYASRLEEYIADLEEYNRRVKEHNRKVSAGTYRYDALMATYHDLKRLGEDLDREREYLDRLLQELGSYPRSGTLGIVSRVEVYW